MTLIWPVAWRHWAGGNFDAVVLDDWHLADAASQAWLPAVTASPDGEEPLRVLVVYRPELAPEASLRLRRLRDAGAAHRLLKPLDEEAVLDLLQRLSGAARPERFARRLTRATGGHPFHIVETLQHLADLGPDTTLCDQANYLLDATQPNVSYRWQNQSVQPTLTVQTAGLYWVELQNPGCTQRDSILIS